MDVSQKKLLLTELLDSKGWGARVQLANACGVLPRTVSAWQNPTEGWPSVQETKICQFFGIDPKTFSGEEKPISIQVSREPSISIDTNPIQEGVQLANEKLDVVNAKLDLLIQAQGLALPTELQSFVGKILEQRRAHPKTGERTPDT